MKKRTPDNFWFPWWPDKWIFGSVRIECTPAERGIWVDLLSLASKDDGHIRANEDTPYPLQQLAGMLLIPEKDLEDAINKFVEKGKLTKNKNGTLYITKWDKYQFSDRHKRRVKERMSAKKDIESDKKDAILNKNTLKNNKLKESKLNITIEQEIQIDEELKSVKGIGEKKRGMIIEYLRELSIEFPELDYVEQMKKKIVWWMDNPLNKESNIHLQLRNWFIKAREFLKEGDKSRGVGKSYMKEPQFLSMELLNKVYQIIDSKGGDKGSFYNKAKSAFPIIRTQWELSDKKPGTFIRLVEGVN